ncbi:MAG: winged helix-turn-helix domain-containing protein [Actinomycetota bacterium]|nr:winged helix-turn-helix domain-containing protein [Actinomycetota bacterium]MDQ3954489.1 winged helix-turn-helix domain-containing protein [Actinomycetota bacterium]
MEAVRPPQGHRSLIVDRDRGVAVVDGQEVVLPRREFVLLAELASRAGEPVANSELIDLLWDEPGMTREDLHVVIYRLRGLIGDKVRGAKMVANRKGFGYFIDPETTDVELVSGRGGPDAPSSSPAPLSSEEPAPVGSRENGSFEPAASVFVGREAQTEAPREPDVSYASVSGAHKRGRAHRRHVALVLVLAGLFGVAGFLSRGAWNDASDTAVGALATPAPTPDATDDARPQRGEKEREPRGDRHERRRPRSRRGGPGDGAPAAVAAAPPVYQPQPQAPPVSGSGPTKNRKPSEPRPRPVALPPPPTRYLYHLYNSENGDHLVTTDGGVVTEYEAKGYEGGAIGRVYVSQEKDTFAIPTNFGTAYVFAHASPKTDPASSVVALWLAQKDGDFFYTTSKAEASKDGWTASASGYVRTL